MDPGNWLAFAMVFAFGLIFVIFFWQAKRQGLFKKETEDIKYKVFEEDEQDFEDVI